MRINCLQGSNSLESELREEKENRESEADFVDRAKEFLFCFIFTMLCIVVLEVLSCE